MPECGGLELITKVKAIATDIDMIIISGYREFDYAQRAIQFGVEDYLLKPIKKNELENALKRILNKRNVINKNKIEKNNMELRIQSDAKKLQKLFIKDLLVRASEKMILPRDFCAEYQNIFAFPFFTMAIIKLDWVGGNNPNIQDYLAIKIENALSTNFKLESLQHCFYIQNTRVTVLVNHEPELREKIKRSFRKIIQELHTVIDVTSRVHVTVGLGKEVNRLESIIDSLQIAKRLIPERIVRGVDCVLDYTESLQVVSAKDLIGVNYQIKLKNLYKELPDINFAELLAEPINIMTSTPNLNGATILEACCEIYMMFLSTVCVGRNNIDQQKRLSSFSEKIDMCTSVSDVVNTMLFVLEEQYIELQSEIKNIEKKPIQDAKIYIKLNYNTPLRLEKVAQQVDLNPSYFSNIFKKETGMNFVEYLTEVRIQAAQELLSGTRESIDEIAEIVGFADSKYFTKVFKKCTNISPNMYRKLYS